MALTKTDTSSEPTPVPSVADSRNTSVWSLAVDGAWKVLVVASAPMRFTVSPETWVQVYPLMVWAAPASMSGSVAEPDSVTTWLAATGFWSSPALTTGTRLAATNTLTTSLCSTPIPSSAK